MKMAHTHNHHRKRPNKHNQWHHQGQAFTPQQAPATPGPPPSALNTFPHPMATSRTPDPHTNAAPAYTHSAAHPPLPLYNPTIPLPPNPFTTLTPNQHLGFLSPATHIAQTFAAETANASTALPLAGHSPAFMAAYTPLRAGENLFLLDPVAERDRVMNIVGGFVRDGEGMDGKKKANRRGCRGGVKYRMGTKARGVGGGRGYSHGQGGQGGQGGSARVMGMERDHGAFEDTQEFLRGKRGGDFDGEEDRAQSVKDKAFDPEATEFRPAGFLSDGRRV